MKIRFPFFEWLYKFVRNVVFLLIMVFLIQYVIAGASLNVSVRYQDIPLHAYRQEEVKYNWVQMAKKVFRVGKEIKDLVM